FFQAEDGIRDFHVTGVQTVLFRSSSELQEWMETFGDLQKSIRYYKRNNENAMVLNKRLFKSPMFLKSPLNKIGEPSTFMFRKSRSEERRVGKDCRSLWAQ